MAAAIVVGAGPGIGAAVVRRLARENLAIGAIARSEASLTAALSGVAGEQTLGLPADVTDEPALRRALDVIVARFGLPDMLVYNAAPARRRSIVDQSTEDGLATWAVSVGGAITATAHLGPRMAQARRGTILLTGRTPAPSGVRDLAELLATAYGPSGVHAAMVILAGLVAPVTARDADAIAEHYWRLHTQPPGGWAHELVLTAEPSTRPHEGRTP